MTVPIYSQFTFGSSTNFITFNDDTFTVNDYVFKAKRRYPTNRDIRQFDTAIPDESGVLDYQTLVGKMYYYIEGTIYGLTETALYDAMEAIRKATSPAITQDDTESDYGYLPLKWTENSPKQLWVKPLYVDIPETRKSAMKPSFRILFKIKRPFIESQDFNVTTFAPSYVAGVGIQIPSTGLLITSNGVNIGADSGTGAGMVRNNGDYKSLPVINITAPVNKPKITNTTTGKYIEFNYNLTSGTANITIDYDGVTATASDGTELTQYLTTGSDIDNFYIETGDNQLTLTATSLGTGAAVSCSFKDVWPI